MDMDASMDARRSRGPSPGPSNRIVASPHEPGVFYVDRETWQVGTRYELRRVLGSGSFSSVCLAWDREENEPVALKRVGDVFASPDYAKRVLREVCIMRRLEHPNIVRLKDVFIKPSPTGKYVFRGGRLVATSHDCYLAMECCEQGDLFNMRGQLPEHEVRSLMWQLLSALRYLHGLNVWHRDIKTGNLLLTLSEGRRVLKVADFGSARSAMEPGEATAMDQPCPYSTGPPQLCVGPSDDGAGDHMDLEGGGGGGGGGTTDGGDGAATSSDGGAEADSPTDVTAAARALSGRRGRVGRTVSHTLGPGSRTAPPPSTTTTLPSAACSTALDAPGSHRAASAPRPRRGAHGAYGLTAVPVHGGGAGFLPPLTTLVCTPCYRAPEVVMSRGGYTSALDMWSAGCVFGELLQRAAYLGKATTPHLQVAPVFAISGKPLTPHTGQHYGAGPHRAPPEGPGAPRAGEAGSSAYAELSALFAVIGTPAWAAIEAVPSLAWRRYLFHIPGRAPTLYRRFGQAGEVAVDLLSRLLAFDPQRRATAEEAMAHEYFSIMHMEVQMAATELASAQEAATRAAARAATSAATAAAAAALAVPAPGLPTPAAAAAAAAAAQALPTWPPNRSGSGPNLRAIGSKGAIAASAVTGAATSGAVGASAGPADMEVEEGPGTGTGPGSTAGGGANGAAGASTEAAAAAGLQLSLSRISTETTAGGAAGAGLWGAGGGVEAARAAVLSCGGSSLGSGCSSLLTKRKQLEDESGLEGAERRRLGGGVSGGGAREGEGPGGAGGGGGGAEAPKPAEKLSFWQIDEPAQALAALEAELASLVPPETPTGCTAAGPSAIAAAGGPHAATAAQSTEALAFVETCKERLRSMLERECEEHAARTAAARAAGRAEASRRFAAVSSGGGSAGGGGGGAGVVGGGGGVRRIGSEGYMGGGGGGEGSAVLHGHLRPDPGQELDPSLIGYERIPYHADAAAARLEPEKHLWAGRHGEWTESSLPAMEQRKQGEAGPQSCWGVTVLPAGLDEATTEGRAYIAALNKQQRR